MKNLLWIFVVLCFFGMSNASAETSCMSCKKGTKLVCLGSPASTVLAKCGSPLSVVETGFNTKGRSKESFKRGITKDDDTVYSKRQRESSTTLKIEEWTYCIEGSYGSDCYLYILRFKGDTLTQITSTLEKGN